MCYSVNCEMKNEFWYISGEAAQQAAAAAGAEGLVWGIAVP